MLTVIVPECDLGMSFGNVQSGKGPVKLWKFIFKIALEPCAVRFQVPAQRERLVRNRSRSQTQDLVQTSYRITRLFT